MLSGIKKGTCQRKQSTFNNALKIFHDLTSKGYRTTEIQKWSSIFYANRKCEVYSTRQQLRNVFAPTKSLAQILRKFFWKGPEGFKTPIFGVLFDAYSESPPMTVWHRVKILPWRAMGKKLFWSRDRLLKHEFDRLGLRLGLGLWSGLWIASGLWLGLGLGFRVGFM